MGAPTLFDFLKAINENGGNPALLESEEAFKAYNPFIINRGVAQSLNTVLFAQEANKAVITDKEMHYAYLFHSVKKSKRFSKWPKKEETSEDLLLVQRAYQVNLERAAEHLKLLSPDDLTFLRGLEDKGGQMGRKKA
jgi:hypothetical protein